MRPSISLACILKNEVKNLPQLLASVSDCFDEIHMTDTGSTDGSIEYLENVSRGTNIHLHHFKWVDDFSKARNASFEPVVTDYVMWLDLDDVLSSAKDFIAFRDHILKIADFWIATYHYTLSAEGKPLCSFARERVFKSALKMKWKYFVHEGVLPKSDLKAKVEMQYATNWAVLHKRTDEDFKSDKNRNLSIFEKNKSTLDHRMKFYYGKELFEAQKPLEGIQHLLDAVSDRDLEMHDRLMGIQYACMCAMQLNQFEKSIELAYQGLQLDPKRAEYFVIIGDSLLKLGKLKEAIPFYSAASQCEFTGDLRIQGALFSHEDSYKHYPLNQLARIWTNIGNMDKGEEFAKNAALYGPNKETMEILKEIEKIRTAIGPQISVPKSKNEDVVISCHPQGLYEWDEAVYRTRGIGGSETAVVEMSQWIAKLTGRKVKIFNNRKSTATFRDVSYISATELPMYFTANTPKVNIAWRHNVKLTDAPTYIWCHDLLTQGMENFHYEKVFALSNFHKNFVSTMGNVPLDKIWVTGNGIDPERFKIERPAKEKHRVIFSSSPDRGLDRAIRVMDLVVRDFPDAKLHCFYGFDNMIKIGKAKEAEIIQKMVSDRSYVIYHGNVSQKELTEQFFKSEVWLYPTNFLETYCITAVEALCTGVVPIVRAWGALPETLRDSGAKCLDLDCESEYEIRTYANAVSRTFSEGEILQPENPDPFSWENVARSWIEYLGL